jgi:N4-gp56 family major capsid protein
MAGPTYFDLTDPEVVQKWEVELFIEVAKRTALMNKNLGLIGEDETSVVQRKKKVFESGGTQATITLSRQLKQKPTFGNQTLRNNEEGLATSTFKWQINQIRHAVAVNGRVTQKRVTWDVWKQSLRLLGEYWPQVMEAGAMLHLAGVPYDVSTTAEWYHDGTDLGLTFSNVPRAADTKHIYRVHEAASDDLTALDTSAILDLDTGSRLVAMAKMLPVPIRPAMIHGQELYVLFVHPYQVAHLKDNSRWLARMRDTIKGGSINGNPLFSGALGIDDGVLWVESPYVPPGIDGSNLRVANARRAIFCGAQALVIGLAKEYDDESTFTNEVESWDYANNKGVAATILAGFAAPYYPLTDQGTTEDYGKIVVTSYAKELITSA